MPLAGAWIETKRCTESRLNLPSRPSRARGLKRGKFGRNGKRSSSRPSRARGLKLPAYRVFRFRAAVAPLAGAWIETQNGGFLNHKENIVAPLAGAWIETTSLRRVYVVKDVAPLAGAWIETTISRYSQGNPLSRPSRARGLKHF